MNDTPNILNDILIVNIWTKCITFAPHKNSPSENSSLDQISLINIFLSAFDGAHSANNIELIETIYKKYKKEFHELNWRYIIRSAYERANIKTINHILTLHNNYYDEKDEPVPPIKTYIYI